MFLSQLQSRLGLVARPCLLVFPFYRCSRWGGYLQWLRERFQDASARAVVTKGRKLWVLFWSERKVIHLEWEVMVCRLFESATASVGLQSRISATQWVCPSGKRLP